MSTVQGSTDSEGTSEELSASVDTASLEGVLRRVDELTELGEHQGALHLLDMARTTFPPNAHVETARGWAFENLGPDHLESAGNAYAEALRLDPEVLEAREGLGNVLFSRGDIDAANQLYREVVERVDGSDGEDILALELQGWCLYKLNEFERAVEVFTTALGKDASTVAVRFDLGLALLARGDVGRAVAEYGASIAQLRRVAASRRVGALKVALEDLDAGMEERLSVRQNYAAREMRNRLAWELSEARAAVIPDALELTADPSGDA